MDKKQKILELQERLDRTLAMPDLTNEESIKSLVKEQLVRSSYQGNEGNIEKVVEKRTPEVSNFLEMLRSASTKYQKAGKSPMYNEWKVKQDTDQVRVMYREGPHGTPFHTLLVEGYADGPLDVCELGTQNLEINIWSLTYDATQVSILLLKNEFWGHVQSMFEFIVNYQNFPLSR